MKEQNPFGGLATSLYTPMSEDEQEVLSRLKAANDFRIIVKGWATIDQPRVIVGDLRLALHFRLNITKPEIPVPVHFFDLELRTGAGILLFKERQSVVYDGKPIMVGDGLFFDMAWDIAITAMDPKLVKMLKPGATGLTSRWTDRDTGDLTVLGNTRMTSEQRQLVHKLRSGEAGSRQDTQRQVAKATAQAKGPKATEGVVTLGQGNAEAESVAGTTVEVHRHTDK